MSNPKRLKLSDTVINQRKFKAVLIMMIALAIIVTNSLIIAAPGFFSHDEWQRFDDVTTHGLRDYAQRFTSLKAGHDFGTPYRPIGFLEQGFSTQWMERLPFVPHMLDVLLHTTVALFLFLALRMARINLKASTLATLLFGASPLTIMATGWVGASFDLWYTFFILSACIASLHICNQKVSYLHLALLAISTGGAVLSKETGIITPAAVSICMIGFFVLNKQEIDWSKVKACAITSTAIIALYLWFRLPSLRESFFGSPAAAYTPGAGNIPQNLLSYIAYPFLGSISEIINFPLVSPLGVGLALLAHAFLLLCVGRRFGIAAVILYIAAYLVFILPVLSLPSGGSHYLYANAIPMSIALGATLQNEWPQRQWLGLGVLIVIIGSLTFHTWRNELFIYNTALCQSNFISSLDTRLAIEEQRGTDTLIIRPDVDAPAHVGLRAIHGRKRYLGELGPVVKIDLNHAEQAGDTRLIATMTRQCTIR